MLNGLNRYDFDRGETNMNVIEEGVYFLYDKDELVYIGTSDNLYRRIGQHIAERTKVFDRFELYPTTDRIRLEGFLIKMFQPKYNVSMGADCGVLGEKSLGHNSDLFPSQTIQEAIAKYDDYKGDPYISDIADEIGTYQSALLRGLESAGAPLYKIEGRFRLDKNWYNSHANEIWNYVK